MRMQALPYQKDIVHPGDNGEGEGEAQEGQAGDPDPPGRVDLVQHDEEYGGYLRESIRLAEDAGAEVAQTGDGVEHGAGAQDGNVAAENQHGELPGNLMQDGEHQEGGAE